MTTSTPSLQIPEPENIQLLLRAIEEAIVQTKVDLAARTVLVSEISEMRSREIELEEEISNARGTIFLLFYETFYLKELESLEHYCSLLEKEIEKLDPSAAPPPSPSGEGKV